MSVFIFSGGIKKIPHLAQFLADDGGVVENVAQASAIAGWGLRPTTVKARTYANQCGLPFIALEDGFLRSTGLGVAGYPPFAMVVDKMGIYYDTTRPSQLEQLILQGEMSATLLEQAQIAHRQIIDYQLSKYNHAPDFSENLTNDKQIVLVIDQTFGDMAVKYGQATEQDFQAMLQAAISENPTAEVWVKTHPDVISGKKKGYLTKLSEIKGNVRLFSEDCNPLSLLQMVQKVYCVTSQMGFEALMLGKTVVTFGVPWFAGWGLTDDRHPIVATLQREGRRTTRSFLQLFTASYLQYSRYLNPNNGQKGTIFDVIDYLHRQRQWGERLRGTLYCVGMSLWKRAVIAPFFRLPQCQLVFVSEKKVQKMAQKGVLETDAKLLIWSEGKAQIKALAQQYQLTILRMEDGFIRSVGLGSNLVAPLSLVVDDMGIYFNAEKLSRLEWILQHQQFSVEDIAQAEQIRQRLVQANIGKYNVGKSGWQFTAPQGKTRILVPGQVEDDASIRFGSPNLKSNLSLLEAVRKVNPEAFIIYKPHPDVVSGNRQGAIALSESKKYADEVVENANILDCIMQVDEVHTMTSLAGFEALLRGKVVHCYGSPFYAHWGLTVDHLNCPRRTRKLNLAELISAVMLYYPLYVNPQTGAFTDCLTAIELLEQQKKQQAQQDGLKRSWWAKQLGKLQQLIKILK